MRISLLPVAGSENPYQKLLIKELNSDADIVVKQGNRDRFFGIIRTAIVQKPDIIHFDWIESFYSRRNTLFTLLHIPIFKLQCFIVRRVLQIKIFWTLHNLYPHDTAHKKRHLRMHQYFAKQCKMIRVFSQSTKNKAAGLLNIPSDKIEVVSQSNYLEEYPNHAKRDSSLEKLNLPAVKKIFLFFGYLKPYKGIEELIHSFKTAELKNCILVLAGQCPDKKFLSQLLNLINEQIIFFNRFIPKEEAQFFFNSADVVILPFKEIENSGSVILAMGFKKAIITKNTEYMMELLSNQTELLFQGDELSQKISSAFKKDITELKEIGEQNYQTVSALSQKKMINVFKSNIN